MYVDGTDQINSVAADSGTLSVLAAAVAVVRERRGAAAAGEVLGTPLGQPVDLRSSSSSSSSGSSSSGSSSSTTCSFASSPGSVGLEGSILWQRMPLDDKPADAASLENDAFREALNRDPRMWRSFSRAELDQLGVLAEVPEQTFIRVEDAYYKPSTAAAQSPSAFGSPYEGALFGYKPLLFPWTPAAALVGFFAGAIFYGPPVPSG